MAADLVNRHVGLIATVGAPPAVAAKAATATIPVIFNVGDPIEAGLIPSLSHPGGNLTGVATMNAELAGKRLELLRELRPNARAVAALLNPSNRAATETQEEALREAAHVLGMQPQILTAGRLEEIDAAFETIGKSRPGGLLVGGDPFLTNAKDRIVALAASKLVPAIYIWREFVAAGGLMSYGADLAGSYRQAGVLAGKILKGARPADLPVEQAVRLRLVVNLKTAKALGVTVPQSIIAGADEVIE